MREFRMPSLGADMDAGTLVEWLKKPGDAVQRGDIIAVVETQKGAIEIEIFVAGVLADLLAKPGDRVPVGSVLATLRGADDEAGDSGRKPAPADRAEPQPSQSLPGVAERAAPAVAPARLKVTPAARRLAAARGIDLATVGAGPDGIIGLTEIERIAAPPPAARRGRPALADMRAAIAAAMSRANREIPHYYVSSTIDVTPMITWLAERNASRSVEQRLLYAAPLLRAVALALRKFPDLNGSYENGRLIRADRINVGVATAIRGGGLMTPAILDADAGDLDALMAKLNDLVKRARGGGLRSSELSMGTVTLTSLGESSADTLLPIIYPPQVAIVGCGQIRLRPWVVDGAVVARQLLDVTLAGDHRASDGRTGAQYLAHLEALLGQPEAL